MVHVIQTRRKELELDFTDRIDLVFGTESAELRAALERHRDYVAGETLAASIRFAAPQAAAELHDVDGHQLSIAVTKAAPGQRA